MIWLLHILWGFLFNPIAFDLLAMQRNREILPVYEAYAIAWQIKQTAEKYKLDSHKLLLVGFGESRWDSELTNLYQISQTWYNSEDVCRDARTDAASSIDCAGFVLSYCKRRYGRLSGTLRCWRGYHIEPELILPKYCKWSEMLTYNSLSRKEKKEICEGE